MVSDVVPFAVNRLDLSLFDLLEPQAVRILEIYLAEHAWPDELRRLKESQFIGVGTYRLLVRLCAEHLDHSTERLITFYEKCKRPKDDPHYEDLIVTVLLSLVLGILANACYDLLRGEFQLASDRRELTTKLWKKFGRAIEYLFRARWIRELTWGKQISQKEQTTLLAQYRARYLTAPRQSQARSTPERLVEIELILQAKAKIHGLDLEDLRESLLPLLIELCSRLAASPEVLEQFRILLEESDQDRPNG